MNKHQEEYLKAMGVDLYVPRSAVLPDSSNTEIISPQITDSAITSAELEPSVLEEGVNPNSAFEVSKPLSEKADISFKAEDRPGVQKESSDSPATPEQETPSNTEANLAEPLYFLWRQVGNILFLAINAEAQSMAENKLLSSIVIALARPEKVESGTGTWPLEGTSLSSVGEAQQFLQSFIEGRSEVVGQDMTLALLGEHGQAFFPEIEGDFDELIGLKIPTEAKANSNIKIKEFRILPSLANMLDKPYLKSLAWQSIKDLRSPKV